VQPLWIVHKSPGPTSSLRKQPSTRFTALKDKRGGPTRFQAIDGARRRFGSLQIDISLRLATNRQVDARSAKFHLPRRRSRGATSVEEPMNGLIARLELLLRGYAAACDHAQGDAGRLVEQFRRDLRLLVAEYGPNAVDIALDRFPDEPGPKASLH